jgi:hypothetical protein
MVIELKYHFLVFLFSVVIGQGPIFVAILSLVQIRFNHVQWDKPIRCVVPSQHMKR